jgi:hypothetical protein
VRLYIITEDGTSINKNTHLIGVTLWKIFLQILDIDGSVVSVNGNTNVYKKFKNIFDVLKDDEYIFIAIDNVSCPATRNFYLSFENLRLYGNSETQKKLLRVFIADYTCVEQIFLFGEHIEMYYKKYLEESISCSAVDFNSKSLLAKYNVLRTVAINKNPLIALKLYNTITDKDEKVSPNIEHFYSMLMSLISNCNGGAKVQNKKLGPCWFNNCNNLKSKKDWYNCKKCNNKTFEKYTDKIVDILSNNHLGLKTLNDLIVVLHKENIFTNFHTSEVQIYTDSINTNNDTDLSLSKVVKMPSHGKVNMFN